METKFNVLLWDFNQDKLIPYDVLPGLYKCIHRMFDGTPDGKLLFEVGNVYKCLSKHDRAEFEVSYGHSVYLEDPVVCKHFIPYEKQDEQKPSDMIEPKFKVGDEIIRSSKSSCPVHSSTDDTICKVAEIHDTCYILDTKDGKIQAPFKWQDYYELIEQKAVEWKQENVEELTEFENAMMHIGGSFFGENAGLNPNDTDAVKEQAQYLLELAQTPAWSEEVDLENELDKEWNKCEPIDEGMGLEIASIEHEQFDNIAKHFFELGLKAQKG